MLPFVLGLAPSAFGQPAEAPKEETTAVEEEARTWTTQSSGTTNELWAVSFVDANTGTAVGEGGTILRTTDGGGD